LELPLGRAQRARLGDSDGRGRLERHAPPKGANVQVQVRRDHLGASRDIPHSIVAGEINGAVVAVAGEFQGMDDRWIVLEDHRGRKTWIPIASVRTLTFN